MSKLFTICDPKHSEEFSIVSSADGLTGPQCADKLIKEIEVARKHQEHIPPYESWVVGFAIQIGERVHLYSANGNSNGVVSRRTFHRRYPTTTL